MNDGNRKQLSDRTVY